MNMRSRSKLLRTAMSARRCCWPVALGLAVVLLAGCVAERPRVAKEDLEYQESYQYPLISPGAQFSALPPAAQNSIRAEVGGADIDRVVKGTTGSRMVYVIYFQNKDLFPPLYIAPDGTVLNPDLSVAVGAPRDTVGTLTGGPVTGVTLSDLPPKVVKAIQQHAPDAEIDFISKETHGDQTLYIVTFKNHAKPPLRLAADGTLPKDTSR